MASFPAFPPSKSSYNIGPGHLCAVCADIPLHELPYEEENGYPHHPTLEALEKSAKTCILCALLYWAAGCTLVNYGGMVSFASTTLPSGAKISLQATESMYHGLLMRGLENGAVMLDLSRPSTDPRPPLVADLKRTFPHGIVTINGRTEHVCPWLFGNWYNSGYVGRKQALSIGLGIRLGTSGKVEDSVDRTGDTVNLRGSYLRYRTDKGALLP